MALLGGVELSYKGNYCELVIWLIWVELRRDQQNKEDYQIIKGDFLYFELVVWHFCVELR